jgi:glucose/arabinose dehydrogenase
MFVGQHGSWNRRPLSGYKVIFVPFAGARPEGKPIDVLTGFVNDKGKALGRPVWSESPSTRKAPCSSRTM